MLGMFELGPHFCCTFIARVRLLDAAVALQLSSKSMLSKIAEVTSTLEGNFCLLSLPYFRFAHLPLSSPCCGRRTDLAR